MARRGYTLLEVMLVLALILIVAAMSMPSMDAMLSSNNVSAARDMVRARWAEMRSRAMEEGRPYRFAVTENTGKFRVAPDDAAYWGSDSTGQGADDAPLIVEGELPPGVLFTTSESAFLGLGDAPSPGPDWGLTVATYLSNGTARDDAEVYFGKAGQRVVGLRLRGLTGAVTAIEPSTNGGGEAAP